MKLFELLTEGYKEITQKFAQEAQLAAVKQNGRAIRFIKHPSAVKRVAGIES